MPEFIANAKKDLKAWLKQFEYLKEQCNLYDSVAYIVELDDEAEVKPTGKKKANKRPS